jgi:hypothetical protein
MGCTEPSLALRVSHSFCGCLGIARAAPLAKIALPKIRPGRYTPSSLVETNRGPPRRRNGRRIAVAARSLRHRTQPDGEATAEFCCVLGFAGMPALPALLGRGNHLAGPSGFWVGHSSERFAVELMSDREPGLCARLPGIHSAGAEGRANARVHPRGDEQTHSLPHRPSSRMFCRTLNPAIPLARANPSCRCALRCP